jgi:microcystin-dependent protein
MSSPYIGELRLVGFSFAPVGWQNCNGALLSIAENDALFNLIGTTYGGDGQTTFAVPDLRGRAPIHQGTGSGLSARVIGETGGVETVTITTSQYPNHTHALMASSNAGTSNNAAGGVLGNGQPIYSSGAPSVALNAVIEGGNGGGNQPHDNLQPYLVLNWIISLFGIFPSQT